MFISKICTLLTASFICISFFYLNRLHADDRPNIVLILVDDLGFGDLRDEVMPNCWDLAQRGARMRLHTHQTCAATRAALFTGLYPQRVNMQSTWPVAINPGLPVDRKIVSEHLSDAGYTCGAFGKWHMGWKERAQWPTRRGFDEFVGFLGGNINSYGTQQSGVPYEDGTFGHDHHGIHDLQFNEVPLYTQKYSTHLFRDFSKRFIRQQSKTDNPFFLYVPFNAPHGPHSAPRKYVDRALATGDFSPDLANFLVEYADDVLAVPNGDKVGLHLAAKLIYRAMVYALDDAIGEIYKELEENGVAENTMFIFASDNGSGYTYDPNAIGRTPIYSGSTFPYRAGKGSNYDGGTRVANFVVWPANVAPQQKIDSNIWIGDLTATFLDIGGVDAVQNADGTTVMPAILENATLKRPHGASRILTVGWRRQNTAAAAIVFRDRKYIRKLSLDVETDTVELVEEELYDLRRDIGETNNVVDNPTYSHWLRAARIHFQQFGGDQMLLDLEYRKPGSVWGDFVFTQDFGFPPLTEILETTLP